MNDVCQICPVFENEDFKLRLVQMEDAKDLLTVYSDLRALPLFNSDNCHGDLFHYTTLLRMQEAIEFWISAYRDRAFVRWSIIDKKDEKAIGTIELFNRKSEDSFNGYGILRLDLKSTYETKEKISSIVLTFIDGAYDLFGCERIATKAIRQATARIGVLKEQGFISCDNRIIGYDGTEYGDYWVRNKKGC